MDLANDETLAYRRASGTFAAQQNGLQIGATGQKRKNSKWAYLVRVAPNSEHLIPFAASLGKGQGMRPVT